MSNGRFISYLRVSTQKQGSSGLGLEAQRAAVTGYLNGGSWNLIQEVVEVESGKNSDRPELAKAISLCRKHKATLVIAKLDRLARNVHFISGLMESKVPFIAVDRPHSDPFEHHLYAAFAEKEGKDISIRTKAALAAAKARGKVLGGRRVSSKRFAEIGAQARSVRSQKAAGFAMGIKPLIDSLKVEGLTSLRDIASALNSRGIQAPRGGEWSAVQVSRLLKTIS